MHTNDIFLITDDNIRVGVSLMGNMFITKVTKNKTSVTMPEAVQTVETPEPYTEWEHAIY